MRSASARTGLSRASIRRGMPSTTSPCTTATSGLLFVGDAVGIRLPGAGILRPATPPPDFDLDLAHSRRSAASPTAARAASRWPTSASRPGTRSTCSTRPRGSSRRWGEVAEAAFREGRDIATALDEAFCPRLRRRRSGATTVARDAERRALECGRLPALAADPRPSGSRRPPMRRRPCVRGLRRTTPTLICARLIRRPASSRSPSSSKTSALGSSPSIPSRASRRSSSSCASGRSSCRRRGPLSCSSSRCTGSNRRSTTAERLLVLDPLLPEGPEQAQDLVGGLLDHEVVEGLADHAEEGEQGER